MTIFIRHVQIFFLLWLYVFINSCTVEKSKVLYHRYSETASDWNILNWNITDTLGEEFILRETVDNYGRVIKLEFLDKGKPAGSLCYLANKVTFNYNENKIIENLYLDDSLIYATDCEMPYKTIYHLDSGNFITKEELFAHYDLNNLGNSTLQQWKKWVPQHTVIDTLKTQLRVDYYDYSYAKMNGIYPVSKNFILSKDYPDEDEPERQSIIDGLQKLKKNINQ